MGVSEILKRTTLRTRDLLKLELEIRLGELQEKWHFSSLEKIFIENRIYRDIEECETWEAVLAAIDKGLKPFKKLLKREVTEDDIVRLTEIKIKRISKFDSFKADEEIKALEKDIEETEKNLKQLTKYTIRWFEELKKKYGKGRERKTEITTFDRVDRSQVRSPGRRAVISAVPSPSRLAWAAAQPPAGPVGRSRLVIRQRSSGRSSMGAWASASPEPSTSHSRRSALAAQVRARRTPSASISSPVSRRPAVSASSAL